MGRKLDLSGLSDTEAEHVLQVVQRDMRLRKKEEERLSELKQELDEEGSRCLLLSRQTCFNQRCCIRCCSPFTFLLNPKRQCHDCHYNICKACRVYNKRDKAWLCSACQKSRLLKTQSLEWFYTNVKQRFKRFGSAKVLKTLYRKHLAEHSALSELTEGSAYEESICNEGSICGSDSAFYRQSEEHSVAETLTVAMRVAEEAIDEAISKAEFDTSSQEQQNEARYLREHRQELVEELAKTIVQKITSRRKILAEMRAEYDHDQILERNADLQHYHQSDQTCSSLKHQANIWRSHSAFSLLDNDPPSLSQESPQTLKKEGSGLAVTAWKSVDRLDNAGLSSVLKSPDGNWIALQSGQLSRPSLLTKRKSQVYSALERESGVVSAYEGLGSDNESKPEADSSWGAVLQEIHRKMTDSNFSLPDASDRHQSLLTGSREDLYSDTEGSWKPKESLLALFKRKVPAEIRRPSSSHRTSIIDVNFNVEGETGKEVEGIKAAGETEVEKVRKSRKKRKSKREQASSSLTNSNKNDNCSLPLSDAVTSDTLTSEATTPEPFPLEDDISQNGANQMDEELPLKQQAGEDPSTREEGLYEDVGSDAQEQGQTEGCKDREEEDEKLWMMEVDLDGGKTEDEEETERDEEMRCRLYRLVAQSRLAYFSSTDDELDRAGQMEKEVDREKDEYMEEENEDQKEEETEGLTYKLCQLEKEVGATQFSSTEDELDRMGVEEEMNGEEDGKDEELAVKVCRLANQVNATQFSSTEDELDRVSRGDEREEPIDEEALWKVPAEEAAQLRDLASLVSACQFSSTEDELDRVGGNEGKMEEDMNQEGDESSIEMEELWEGSEECSDSIGDMDVKMFDLREETGSNDEKMIIENALDGQTKVENVKEDHSKEERILEEKIMKDSKADDKTEVWKGYEAEKEPEQHQMTEVENVFDAKREQKKIEAEVQHENHLEAMCPDETKEGKLHKENFGGKETILKSDDEEEFDRIINSMLLMNVEEMQEERNNKAIGRKGLKDKDMDMDNNNGGDNGFRENCFDAKGSCLDETEKVRVEEKPPAETASEKSEGDNPANQEKEDITVRYESVQEDSQMSLVKEDPPVVVIQEILERKEATGKRNENVSEKTEDEDRKQPAVLKGEAKQEASTHCEKKDIDQSCRETEEDIRDDMQETSSSSLQEGLLSPEEVLNDSDMELYKIIEFISTLLEQRYSAVSLCSITTEVLKVLNATEELLQGAEGGDDTQLPFTPLPPNTDLKKLDQQFSKLEENVYVAAGSVYSLEAELSDLEECARGISSSTSDMELSFLEEQVAAAAAKVQQSELKISNISARIAALKSAGLNVDPQSHFIKNRTIPVMPVTLNSSRQLRRRLPAPPVKGYLLAIDTSR
ncbi:uncharacterized protein myripa [Pholidichthys leucotaenia]